MNTAGVRSTVSASKSWGHAGDSLSCASLTMVLTWGREYSICLGFWLKRHVSFPFGQTMTTCGLYTRSTKKVRIGTSCDGHTDGASFQNEATRVDFSGSESLIGEDYSVRSSQPRTNGLRSFSSAIVVPGPWPQTTRRSPGSEYRRSRIEERINSPSPPQRSVRPM